MAIGWCRRMSDYENSVNKTYSKPFSKRQALPWVVMKHSIRTDKILDFGAGKDAYGTQILRDHGFQCDAWEIGKNFVDGVHDTDAITKKYDAVFFE